jgi:hypothetical protein
VLALLGLLFIRWATLTPALDPNGMVFQTPIWCLVCGDHGGADIVVNLLLFLPFAAGLRLAGLSWRRVVILSAAVSFTVELLQLLVVPGRDASLSDLLTNTASGAIGAAVAPHLPVALRPSPRQARSLFRAGVATWLAAMALSAWLLTPFLPNEPLRSTWAGATGARDVFLGTVRAVTLNGRVMPKNAPPPDGAGLGLELGQGRLSLAAQLTSGPPVGHPWWIYKLKARSSEAIILYQYGRQAGVAVPVRGLAFLLNPVTVTLPDGLPETAGVAVSLEAGARGGLVRLRSTYGSVTRSINFGLSPAYGWRLFSPFELGSGNGVRWFTGLCLAVSTLPLAYWGARTRRALPWVPGLGVATGLTAPAWLAGLPPAHWSEWVGAAAGVLTGWALRHGAAYLERRCASPSASGFSSS